ncbi:hypothetical protein DFP72DRAFT_641361 [Ephemerocybe angulata]|uniref:Uncharacterized protein n=1 Tax=Ephemerocybe angulata TaxID=980116 RepID=A0A8H6HHV5_9AGAR|nr:hypothetical protein DFP72DRAFT_641361 [Tulosesus angulatus]
MTIEADLLLPPPHVFSVRVFMHHSSEEENLSRFEDIPDDIARSIFELAAEERNVACHCAVASRKIKAWVEPVLYRRIAIDSPTRMANLHRTIRCHPSKGPKFFSSNVKALYINWQVPWGFFTNLIRAFQSVEKLEIHFRLPYDSSIERIANLGLGWKDIRPRMLLLPMLLFKPAHRHFRCGVQGEIEDQHLHRSLFLNVTHLELVVHGTLRATEWDWTSLAQLETLTHLCLSTSTMYEECAVAAQQHLALATASFPPSLRVCVVSF